MELDREEGRDDQFCERRLPACDEMGISRLGQWLFEGYWKYFRHIKTFELRPKNRKPTKKTSLISMSWIDQETWSRPQNYETELKARLSATGYKMKIITNVTYRKEPDYTVCIFYPFNVEFHSIETWCLAIIYYVSKLAPPEQGEEDEELPPLGSKLIQNIYKSYTILKKNEKIEKYEKKLDKLTTNKQENDKDSESEEEEEPEIEPDQKEKDLGPVGFKVPESEPKGPVNKKIKV